MRGGEGGFFTRFSSSPPPPLGILLTMYYRFQRNCILSNSLFIKIHHLLLENWFFSIAGFSLVISGFLLEKRGRKLLKLVPLYKLKKNKWRATINYNRLSDPFDKNDSYEGSNDLAGDTLFIHISLRVGEEFRFVFISIKIFMI